MSRGERLWQWLGTHGARSIAVVAGLGLTGLGVERRDPLMVIPGVIVLVLGLFVDRIEEIAGPGWKVKLRALAKTVETLISESETPEPISGASAAAFPSSASGKGTAFDATVKTASGQAGALIERTAEDSLSMMTDSASAVVTKPADAVTADDIVKAKTPEEVSRLVTEMVRQRAGKRLDPRRPPYDLIRSQIDEGFLVPSDVGRVMTISTETEDNFPTVGDPWFMAGQPYLVTDVEGVGTTRRVTLKHLRPPASL
jgi:hypothetical protein